MIIKLYSCQGQGRLRLQLYSAGTACSGWLMCCLSLLILGLIFSPRLWVLQQHQWLPGCLNWRVYQRNFLLNIQSYLELCSVWCYWHSPPEPWGQSTCSVSDVCWPQSWCWSHSHSADRQSVWSRCALTAHDSSGHFCTWKLGYTCHKGRVFPEKLGNVLI